MERRWITISLVLVLGSAIVGFLIGAAFSGAGLKPGPAFERAGAWIEYGWSHHAEEYRQAGQARFETSCGACHGITRDDAARLAHHSFQRYTDIGVFRVVANGQGQGDMPAFSSRVSDRNILQVVAYLESLHDEQLSTSAAPWPLADDEQLSTSAAPWPLADGDYEYVAVTGGVLVYSIGDGFSLVGRIRISGMHGPRGITVHAASNRLYVSFHGEQSGPRPAGRVVAIDLRNGDEVWRRRIEPGIDSLAVTPDGRKLYVPDGEHLVDAAGWTVLESEHGRTTGRITFGRGSHNTQVSSDGKRVYLAGIGHNFLGVADVETDQVTTAIGPFEGVLRPFALTGDGRYALVNVQNLSGFAVADLMDGNVIHRVEVAGWPWSDPPGTAAQSHGIAISPDGREAWVSDSWNRRMHVFDISKLPARPIQGVDIPLSGRPKWMRFTRDGQWVHVSTGEIVEAHSHRVVAHVAPSRYYVQVSWREGSPVAGYSRYGNGYERQHE